MLVKFTADGTRLWATYYGGGLVDYGYGCDVDADGNVFLAGFTRSPDNIGMDGHQNSIGGAGTSNTDGFLVKFNGLPLRHLQSLHDRLDAVTSKDAHQRIIQT